MRTMAFVLCCLMAPAASFVTTPLATRRSPLALRVATALPIMNMDPADAMAEEGAAVANITEVPAKPALTREEEKLDIFSVAKKAAPVVAVAGALFVIATTLAPVLSPSPPPAPPPPVVLTGKQNKKKPAPVQAKAETAKEKETKAKAAKKAKEAEKKAAKKDKKAAKTKPTTPAVIAPVATAGKPKAAPLLTPEARAQRTAAETQEVAKTTEGATISAAKKASYLLATYLLLPTYS
tara:strand:- start:166 stop:876 length:711 start_codon:yes stop_codon:yes gene_type:complete